MIFLSYIENLNEIELKNITNHIMKEDLFSENSLELVKKHSPVFYKTLVENGFESVLISKIRDNKATKGYLVCAVRRSLRIWQENECAILFYLAELIADSME